MEEIFRAVLTMSITGSVITAAALILKPVTLRLISAAGQTVIWLLVMAFMLFPFGMLIPEKAANVSLPVFKAENEAVSENTEPEEKEESLPMVTGEKKIQIRLWNFLPMLWLSGAAIYLSAVGISYLIYLRKIRSFSVSGEQCEEFETVKKALKIRRKIPLKQAKGISTPLLCGVFFPVVYLPEKEFSKKSLEMIFLHELCHYKRKDLFLKWLAILTNAIHWFNPLAWLIPANVGEACEIACDMKATKNMSESEKKEYMQTILSVTGEIKVMKTACHS